METIKTADWGYMRNVIVYCMYF